MALPIIHRYVLDTLANFSPQQPPPGTGTGTSTSANFREATRHWSATPAAARALALLPASAECEKALRFLRPGDAALSLASSLLKHVAIARLTATAATTTAAAVSGDNDGDGNDNDGSGGSNVNIAATVPWRDTQVTQERHIANGKPFFAPGGVSFNASHHGHLAVVAAAATTTTTTTTTVKVGVDVVQVDVAKGAQDVQRSGGGRWAGWARVFEEAFSEREIDAIVAAGAGVTVGPATDDDEEEEEEQQQQLEAALRTFYAYWALKEAYIKMTSEAFMAGWLRELEFRNVRVPRVAADGASDAACSEGETVRDIEVWLRGERVRDVHIELQAVGRTYMIATAADRAAVVRPIERIEVERDVYPLTTSERPPP